MSAIIQTRGEAGGGVAAHLQCPHCGLFSKSHAQQLSHLAAFHPTCLDDTAVGRLGNILMYQSSARLFHCSICFYTIRDFGKLFKHIVTKHCTDKREGGGGERRGEGVEECNVNREVQEEGVRDDPTRKKSGEGEEEEQGEGAESVKPEDEGDKSVLVIDGGSYRCLICGWRTKHKAASVSHVVRKHEIPKGYATQAIRWEDAAINKIQGSGAEDEEGAGLSEEMLKEEIAAMAKVISYISNRYVCLFCGWKSKLKGFTTNHVVRSHHVACPYRCKECSHSFFLPSQLQQHVRSAHRPGRYACPFCCFRSEYQGGFGRHCGRCSAREEEGGEGGAGGGEEEDIEEEEEAEEKEEVRRAKKPKSPERSMGQQEDEDDED